MPNDNHLIDEYDKLQKLKNEIDTKIEFLKVSIIKLAQEKNTDVLFGTNKKCSIKRYDKIIYPLDKTQLVELIKMKGLYEKFSSINYFKLGPAIIKCQVGEEIESLVKKENAFRLFLIDLGR